ncbi:unnamed protein product [Meloidogyne enterolobii]|uniref:Uncharacterized protein n=1 Tax=Meloidogyne enterolobii TaxID=390850 RepID=A0ACB0YTL8_MELEN
MSLIFESPPLLDERQSTKLFNYLFILSQCFGILAVFGVAIWMGAFEDGGFSWSENPSKQFHYHPTFMVIAVIFLQGESILVYRVFRNERKRFVKLLHLSTHSVALLLVLIALKAVWDSHDLHKNSQGEDDPLPNLVSLHSWIGISSVIFYFLQFGAGFLSFFWPGLSQDFRRAILPFHQLGGLLILFACTVTALLGISEYAAWHHGCWTVGKELCGRQLLSNLLGFSLIGFSACVFLLIANPRWKRRPLPEEECLNSLVDEE